MVHLARIIHNFRRLKKVAPSPAQPLHNIFDQLQLYNALFVARGRESRIFSGPKSCSMIANITTDNGMGEIFPTLLDVNELLYKLESYTEH